MPLQYLLVLDFEATCDDRSSNFNRAEQEIIEFPCLLFNLHTNTIDATFHEYVKPQLHPTLSHFCTDLTGIQQKTVDNADPFPRVWTRFLGFLSGHILDKSTSFAFVTCGNWDLRTMLPTQLSLSSRTDKTLSTIQAAEFKNWINIKFAFRDFYKLRRSPNGMLGMLETLKMDLEGRHHSGIDDCRNIARIVAKMRADGWNPRDNTVANE